VILRPYQERSVPALRAQYAAGHRAVLYVLPTGGGKTTVAAAVILLARGRVLFLAHRRELIAQTVATLARAGVTDVRVIRAQHDTGPGPRVTVASVQTVIGEDWGDRLPEADLVIVDEAHHVKARTWEGLLARYPAARVLGLTATPQRGDGKALGDVFQALVVGATVKELTELEHLVPCRAWSPPDVLESGELAMTPLEAYRKHAAGSGEPPADLVAQLADPAARDVLRDWYEERGWQRAIVFCADVKHARATAHELFSGGVRAEVVHGGLPNATRAEILSDFATGRYRAICNVACLTEGWDDPGCSVAILARRFGKAGEFLQAVGRVLRPAGGKTHATLVDLCGSVLEHGTPEADRRYTLDGVGIQRSDSPRDAIRQCPACGGVFLADDVEDGACPQCGAALPKRERKEPESVGVGVEDVTELAKRKALQLMRNLRSAARASGRSPAWVDRAFTAISARRFAWR
jgi:DNA repair protein RadD